MVPMSDVTDELDDSPMLEEVLGDALGKLRVFHAKLAEEGEPRGLIGPRDVGIIWERHILNSAAIVPFVKEATAKKQFKTVADIGSGGGFPGIVAAACLPDHRFTLVEPMERRVEWLNECVADMELNNVTVVRARANEMIEAIAGAAALKAAIVAMEAPGMAKAARTAGERPFAVLYWIWMASLFRRNIRLPW